MSENIATIFKTGKNDRRLNISEFYGGDNSGKMLQLTQGFGRDTDEPGFIQLTRKDVKELIDIFKRWID